jgi:hypothetical protein
MTPMAEPFFRGSCYELWKWLGTLPIGFDARRVIVYEDEAVTGDDSEPNMEVDWSNPSEGEDA